jgi:hypothetical protein
MDIRYSHKKKQVSRHPEEIFEIAIQEAKNDDVFRKRTQTAIKWYLALIKRLSPTRIDRADFTKRGRLRSNLQLGHMYCYVYDAKTKDELPYWDRFPLIFPIELTENGWYGLNLHYIPIQFRAKVLSVLYRFLNNKKYDETTRITLTYRYLKDLGASDKALMQVAFKQYLTNRVKSRFIHISPDEWPIALYLPMEQWQKQSFSKVYSDIDSKIKQLRNK